VGGRQFDCQCDAFKLATDAGDDWGVRIAQFKSIQCGRCAFDEKLRRRVPLRFRGCQLR
jgi:hypothetical protein